MVAQSKAGGGILLIRGCVGRTRHIAPPLPSMTLWFTAQGVEGELFMYPARSSVLVTVSPPTSRDASQQGVSPSWLSLRGGPWCHQICYHSTS